MKSTTATMIRSRWFSSAPVPSALAAALCFAASVIGFGAALRGYSQFVDPVAVLGAIGVPHAAAFNLLGFIAPGLLLAGVAVALYRQLPGAAGAMARIGTLVLLFSTLAFAAQGLFSLDLDDLDAIASRVHVGAWSLWWLTTGAGATLLAVGLWRLRTQHRRPLVALAMSAAVLGLALFAPAAWGHAIPQRMAYAAWFGWWWLAARAVSRNAISFPGSSPPTRT